MTNGDKIRKMSDEDLAGLLANIFICPTCLANSVCSRRRAVCVEINFTCVKTVQNWLKQEAKDD